MAYRLDTHVHTSEVSSCARVPAEEMPQLYKSAGYQGVVVTDHYYDGLFERHPGAQWEEHVEAFLRGYKTAKRIGDRIGIDIFLGMELRFTGDGFEDYLIYGHDEVLLLAHPHLEEMGLVTFRAFAQTCGVVVFQAHPFRVSHRRAHPELLDGVEVMNGNPRHDSHNADAQLFAAKNGLISLSGSDFHQVEDLARGGVLLTQRPSSERELAQMLVSGGIEALVET